MGLNKGDLEKVPPGMTKNECHTRIYNWHVGRGKSEIEIAKGMSGSASYVKRYLDFRRRLVPPEKVGSDDIEPVFDAVLAGLMEWSYHKEDESGIRMGAYAHFGKRIARA